jgi:hypothetical protein
MDLTFICFYLFKKAGEFLSDVVAMKAVRTELYYELVATLISSSVG